MSAPCKIGDRIRLIAMPNDPDPVPVGTEGVVTRVTMTFPSGHQISVRWDNGRMLHMITPPDTFEVIQ